MNLPQPPNDRQLFTYAADLVARELEKRRIKAVRADNVFNEYDGERAEVGPNPQMAERLFLDACELSHIHARLLAEARKDDK